MKIRMCLELSDFAYRILEQLCKHDKATMDEFISNWVEKALGSAILEVINKKDVGSDLN